jgi:hypothetical protein
MFPLTANTKFTDKTISITGNDSITLLDRKLGSYYFSPLDFKMFDWNTFSPSLETSHIFLKEEEELA